MRNIKYIFLLSLICQVVYGVAPEKRLICKATSEPFTHPLYSPSGDFLAFATSSLNQIIVYDFAQGDTHTVVSAQKAGRRFCFEPGVNRIVYRHASMADPARSERIISTDLYSFGPTHLTKNIGPAFGPYRIADKIWYRTATDKPLLDTSDSVRVGGMYFQQDSGRFWVLDDRGDTLTAQTRYRIEGGEFSPDGTYFAAVSTRPDRHVLLINIKDGSVVDFDEGAHPAWSGNSAILAFHTLSKSGEPTFIRTANMITRERGFMDIGSSEIVTDLALNVDATRLAWVNRNGDLYEMNVTIIPEP